MVSHSIAELFDKIADKVEDFLASLSNNEKDQ
jgi:hypothetical protein